MTTSTLNMLRIMQPTKSGTDEINHSSTDVGKASSDLRDIQRVLAPSPSMIDVLKHCLGTSQQLDNTPLK